MHISPSLWCWAFFLFFERHLISSLRFSQRDRFSAGLEDMGERLQPVLDGGQEADISHREVKQELLEIA